MNTFIVLAFAFLSYNLVHCMPTRNNDDYHGAPEIKIGDGYHEAKPDYYDHDYYEPKPDYSHEPDPDYYKPEPDYYEPEPDYYKPEPDYRPPHNDYGSSAKKNYDCGDLPDIKNGKVEIVPDTKKASIAMYFCNDGFILYGKQQRICSYGGQWSGRAPKCIPIDCGYLPNIANGRLILSGTGFRDTATYLCKEGFDLIGERQRKCQEDAEWSNSAPVCAKISCPKLSAPENGKIFTTGIYPSDIAQYTCFKGFFLDGQKKRTCQRDGEWTGTDPECKKIKPIDDIKSLPPKKDDYNNFDDYDKHDDYTYDNSYDNSYDNHYGY